MRRVLGAASVFLPLLAVGLTACGGPSDSERFSLTTPGSDVPIEREVVGSQKPRTGKPTQQEVSVIRGWANALRAGHVNQAAAFFALPALIADGTSPKRRVADRNEIRDFNRGLPCGAKLLETKRGADSFVVATFKLTERPGPRPAPCGDGTGGLAAVIFLVERHHIVQWLRAADPAQPPKSDTS
jgi:hypothetical protein